MYCTYLLRCTCIYVEYSIVNRDFHAVANHVDQLDLRSRAQLDRECHRARLTQFPTCDTAPETSQFEHRNMYHHSLAKTFGPIYALSYILYIINVLARLVSPPHITEENSLPHGRPTPRRQTVHCMGAPLDRHL